MFINEQTILTVVMECQDWWDKNCLFLDPKARKAFQHSYLAASDHAQFLKDKSNPKLVKENWSDIAKAGSIIVNGVALPSLGEAETKLNKQVKTDRRSYVT